MTEEALSTTFAALADPTRRTMLETLARGPATVGELAEPHPMSLPAISRHLKVLEEAGLVVKQKRAQWRSCHLEIGPLLQANVWIEQYRRFFETRVDALAEQLESKLPTTEEEES